MSQASDLGQRISEHAGSSGEIARSLAWLVGLVTLGVVGTMYMVNNPGKGDPQAMLWVGIGVTCVFALATTPWLIPALLRFGQSVELFERGIVYSRRGATRSIPFAEVDQIAEDIEYHQWAESATKSHTLTLTHQDGSSFTLSSGALSDFDELRSGIVTGVTEALVPLFANALCRGETKAANLAVLSQRGIVLSKTMGGRGKVVPWESLLGVGIHPELGHVLLDTADGVIDTQAYMSGIPHWFLLPPLAEEMVRRQTAG